MKFFLITFILISPFTLFENISLALSDRQIKEICEKKKRRLTCIKDYEIRRSILLEGNRIEIPVIPFRND